MNIPTKTAIIDPVTFNDSNGPRPFIAHLQVSLTKDGADSKIFYQFDTNGELGGGIDKTQFSMNLVNVGGVPLAVFQVDPFEGPCRGGFHHWQGELPLDERFYDDIVTLDLPTFTVNVYAC